MSMEIPPPPGAGGPGGAAKPDRKTVERNRRNQMKALYSRLDALVRPGPGSTSATPATTLPERLEAATAYVKRTQERLEGLKERRRELLASSGTAKSVGGAGDDPAGASSPAIEVQHLGGGLHAVVASGAPDSRASFHRAVRAVEETGGEVLNAHFSVVGAKALYTMHTSIGEQGNVEMVMQRLKEALRGDATSA